MSNTWVTRIKVLLVSAVFVTISNMICTWRSGGTVVMPWESVPALAIMFVVIVVGCLLQELVQKYLKLSAPSILFISAVMILCSIPGFSPIAGLVQTTFAKLSLLPLCTPILAYAGISIGKDLDNFKKQGIGIVCTALCTFLGTFIGSALIAQIILSVTGVI